MLLKSVLTLLPIVWLIVALAVLKLPGHKACLAALAIAAVLALTLWRMPVADCATSALEGFAAALWPIILVIIAAIYTYNLSLRTEAMDVIKRMLAGVSRDKRVIILLIGWCFGGFLEGMAGFGTAIAIPASMLVVMGMEPVTACLVCMLANAFPTAFGSVGIPTVTLASVTGLDPMPLAFITVVQMLPFMLLIPFLMVIAGGGVKALSGVTGLTLAAGVLCCPSFWWPVFWDPSWRSSWAAWSLWRLPWRWRVCVPAGRSRQSMTWVNHPSPQSLRVRICLLLPPACRLS